MGVNEGNLTAMGVERYTYQNLYENNNIFSLQYSTSTDYFTVCSSAPKWSIIVSDLHTC